MSKLAMKKIFICGLRKDGKAILDLLQRASVVEINVFDIENNNKLLTSTYNNDKLSFDRYVKNCDDVLEIFDKYVEDKNKNLLSTFDGTKEIKAIEYNKRVADVKSVMQKVTNILTISKNIDDAKQEIPKLENKILQYEPWKSLDIPLNCDGTNKTFVLIGSIKNDVSIDEISNKLFDTLDKGVTENVFVNILNHNKEMTAIMIVGLKEYKNIIEDNLKKLDFNKAPLSSKIPTKEIDDLNSMIKDAENRINKNIEKIKAYANDKDNIMFTRDYYKLRSDKYDTISKIGLTDNAYFIEGFVPQKYADSLVKVINNKMDAYVEITDTTEEDDVPVLLENNLLVDPMETVVESYSLPNEHEFDPSKIMAFFYYIFFGMMLSDAGYGLILAIGCGIVLLKSKNMNKGMRKLIKLFFYSSISTIFWGLMFGSFFGDSIDVIGHTYFGVPADVQIFKPLWFEPIKKPMKLLVFAFLLGIIHLFTGLFIKFYLCVKDGNIKDAIYDVVFWVMFVGGGIFYLLTMPMITNMLGISDVVNFPPIVATISSVCAIIGAIGVLFTGGRESKNWGKRLLKGAYAVYGVSGWLSDILSYSRILALGLATGAIAQVINQMGSMLHIPVLGLIVFIVVFIFGHILNIGINVLGSYVHTNRLQFVEFFGKFYEGGGRKFEPFKEDTKYYYVEEDI